MLTLPLCQILKRIIEDSNKRRIFEIWTNDVISLIKYMNDPDYIDLIVDDEEKRKKLGLSSDNLIKLILQTRDKEYIKSLVEDKKKTERLGLDVVVRLISEIDDKPYARQCFQYIDDIYPSQYLDEKSINLPENMTIGIEIESEGKNTKSIKMMTDIIGDGWICKRRRKLRKWH